MRDQLRSGEVHEYRLPLEADQVVDAVVEQDGIDVSLQLIGPGRELRVDSPSGDRGAEHLIAVSEEPGTYLVRVEGATAEKPVLGNYVLAVQKPRPASQVDWKRAKALAELIRCRELRKAEPRQAVAHCKVASYLWWTLGERDQQYAVLKVWAGIHQDQGDLKEAVVSNEKALLLAPNLEEQVLILNRLCFLKARLVDLGPALEAGQRALELVPALGNPALHAGVLNNLGVVYRGLGETDQAMDHFQKSLHKWKEASPHSDEALPYSNLAELHLAVGNPKPALEYLKEARAIWKRSGTEDADTWRLFGVALEQIGSRDISCMWLLQARELARAQGNRLVEVQALNDLGTTQLAIEDLIGAHDSFEQARRIASQTEDQAGEAYALAGLGMIQLEQGDASGALRHFAQSRQVYQAAGDPTGLAAVLYRQALAHRSQRDLGAALTSVDEALALVEFLREGATRRDLRVHVVGARTDIYDLKADLLLRLNEREPGKGYAAEAFEASEWRRARSLLDMLSQLGGGVTSNVHPDLLQKQEALRRRLQMLAQDRLKLASKQAGEELSRTEREIRDTLADWEVLAEDLRRQSPTYAALTAPEILGVREVQELLDPETALVAYTLGEERSILWWIEKEAFEVRELPGGERLEKNALRAYELISERPQRAHREEERRLLETLGQDLLGPVVDRLGRVRRLAVVADGALQTLPFVTFSVPTSPGHPSVPLVDTHAVVQLPSASLLAVLRSRQAGREKPTRTIAVFGDPVFSPSDPRFQALPVARQIGTKLGSPDEFDRLLQSRREVDAILALVPAEKSRSFVGFRANRRAVLDPALGSFQFIHFAAHGLVDVRNPDLSGIQLSRINQQGELWEGEGIFPFYEAYNLNLLADLVTLGACKTAIGPQVPGEGPLGLSRSFLYAGASRVVGALWDVDDAATAALMTRFYEGVLRDGKPPSEALREAQRAVRDMNKDWHSPNYWAGFVLQGDWR